jgi:hypothetical protein
MEEIVTLFGCNRIWAAGFQKCKAHSCRDQRDKDYLVIFHLVKEELRIIEKATIVRKFAESQAESEPPGCITDQL